MSPSTPSRTVRPSRLPTAPPSSLRAIGSANAFPIDGVIGEEFAPLRPDAATQWIIDPIDGTKAFVRGVPLWGTLVAVCEGERVLAGAACFPVVKEVVSAAPGEGCWWNGSRARVSEVSTLSEATMLTTDSRFPEHAARGERWRALCDEGGVSRTWGDCYGYLLRGDWTCGGDGG